MSSYTEENNSDEEVASSLLSLGDVAVQFPSRALEFQKINDVSKLQERNHDEGRADGPIVQKRSNCFSQLCTPSCHVQAQTKEENYFSVSSCAENFTHSSRCLPAKLMTLLLDDTFSDILTFLPDGKAFIITRLKLFISSLMSRFLGISKFSTFVRKLNHWGFEQINNQSGPIEFRHPLFVKGDWKSLQKLRLRPRSQPLTEKISTGTPSSFQIVPRRKVVSRSSSPQNIQSETDISRSSSPQHVQSIINRHLEISDTLDAKIKILREENRRFQSYNGQDDQLDNSHQLEKLSQIDVNNVTKVIVDAAIDCLMRDEDHTRILFDRQRRQLRRPSILPRGMLTSAMTRNILARTSSTYNNEISILKEMTAANQISYVPHSSQISSLLEHEELLPSKICSSGNINFPLH